MSIARKIVEFAINSDSSDIHIEENKEIALRINSDIEIFPLFDPKSQKGWSSFRRNSKSRRRIFSELFSRVNDWY